MKNFLISFRKTFFKFQSALPILNHSFKIFKNKSLQNDFRLLFISNIDLNLFNSYLNEIFVV